MLRALARCGPAASLPSRCPSPFQFALQHAPQSQHRGKSSVLEKAAKEGGDGMDFGLNQQAPRAGDILTTRVLTWTNGMEWIDISCAAAIPKASPDDTPDDRKAKAAQWAADIEMFRASLVPVLTKLDVPSIAVTRAGEKHALPGILAVEDDRPNADDKDGDTTFSPSHKRRRMGPSAAHDLRTALRPHSPMSRSLTNLQAPNRPGISSSSGSLTMMLEDAHTSSGITDHEGIAFCPLRSMPSSAQAAARAKEASEGVTSVCALMRYAPDGDDTELAAAHRAIDRFGETGRFTRSSIHNAALQGFSRTLRGLMRSELSRESHSLSSIEDITNRVTLFAQPQRLVTVHVREVPFIKRLRAEWDAWYRHSGPLHVVNAIVKGCARSFRDEASDEMVLLDRLESVLFRRTVREYDHALKLLYAVSRRSSIHARVLAPMPATHASLCLAMGIPTDNRHVQDVQTGLKTAGILCAEVRNSTQGLLSLHFQRSASELESMMRVLTVFSALFIPLELITSVFGANFEHWWEFEPFGFAKVCLLMALTSGITVSWFRLKRFI